MSIYKEIFTISYSRIIFSLLIIIIIVLTFLFYFDILKDDKWASIISGLLTGFVIALFQALLSWFEFKKLDELKALKINKILQNRKDPNYYGDLIYKAKKEIKLLGITAFSFLEDFANENPHVSKKEKVLLAALSNPNLKVKILVADKSVLDERHKSKAVEAEKKLRDLKRYKNFEYAFYDQHTPTHSVLIIDDEFIVGPIFPKVNSRDTPAIHLQRDSQLAKYYETYFNDEWDECIKKQKYPSSSH